MDNNAQGVVLDRDTHEIVIDGNSRKYLAPKEFSLLCALIEAKGRVLTREHLLKDIWGHDDSIGIDTRTVDQHFSRLRRKLGNKYKHVVATMPNFGYRVSGNARFNEIEIDTVFEPKTLKEAVTRLGQNHGLAGLRLDAFVEAGVILTAPFARKKR